MTLNKHNFILLQKQLDLPAFSAVSKSIQSATRLTALCPDCLSRVSKRVLHSAENFAFRYCTLVRSLFPRLIGVYQHISQIYLIASKLICARVNINTNPMFQYFLRILGKKYFDMCPLGTKQRIPNSLFKLSLHKRIFLTNVGKPSRPFKFQHLIWQARNIFYNNVHKTKKQKTVCSSFSATGLIRYVEMVKRIFTSSKHWLTGVNIPPANKNRQCTAIITMGIKQEQAQFTPNQNSTTTICNPDDGRKFAIQLSKTNWTSTKFQKLLTNEENFPSRLKTLTICTSPKF